MKVELRGSKEINGRRRASAEIHWETVDRPSEEIYFEVDEQYSGDISCNPDAFFLATVFPAMYYGEERYNIEGEVCPILFRGVKDAMGWISHTYHNNQQIPIRFDIQTRTNGVERVNPGNAATFLSGGVDSYATLIDNHLLFSKEHPGYIRDTVVAFGLEQSDPEKFEYVISMLKKAAKNFDVELIPVYTNIYLIYREEDALNHFYFWKFEFQGAALAAIAHILSNRLSSISIAATFDLANLGPYGSHPLLDPNYSSEYLTVRHDGLNHSRLEKARIVTENYPPPINLRVCNMYKKYNEDSFNCGKCEKCTRTMLEFLVLGRLEKSNAFPYQDVTGDMVIKHAKIKDDYGASCYEDLIDPLRKIEREDLARAVEFVIKRYRKKENVVKSSLRNIDNKFFYGKLRKMLR